MDNQKNNPSYLKLAQFNRTLHAKLPLNYIQPIADVTSETPTIVHRVVEDSYVGRELAKLTDLVYYVFSYRDKFVVDEIDSLMKNYDVNWRLPRGLKNSLVDSVLKAQLQREDSSNPRSSNGITHFHAACLCDNARVVEFFLKHGVDVNESVNVDSPIYAGFTPLHLASDPEVVNLLLKHGAGVRLKNADGSTARQLVLYRNLKIAESTSDRQPYKNCFDDYLRNERILMSLLDHSDDTGLSALHVACTLKDTSVVKRLLKTDVDVNEKLVDSSLWPGFTALHFAAIFNVETMRLLIENGADIEDKDAKGITPFDICVSRATIPDLHFIVSRKESWKRIVLSDEKTLLVDLLSAMKDLNFRSFLENTDPNIFVPFDSPLWPGFTVLHLSVLISENSRNFDFRYCNDPTIYDTPNRRIEFCLWRNADVNAKNASGETPIHLAFRLRNFRAIELLLQFGNKRIDNVVDNEHLSHLQVACAVKKLSVIADLASFGVDDKSLHIAVSTGCFQSVKILLKYGADVNAKAADGLTPIHRSFVLSKSTLLERHFEFSKIARELLSSTGLRESIAEDLRLSHLHVATYWNNLSAMKRLLDMGSDVNLMDRDGETPLSMARFRRAEELLIARGADVFARRKDGTCWLTDVLKSPNERVARLVGEMIRKDEDFEKRAFEELGWTLLHVNCRILRPSLFNKSMREEIDANARISKDSTLFPGCTALSVLVASRFVTRKEGTVRDRIFRELVEKKKVDVTVMDVRGNTAVHMADYCSRIALLNRVTNFNVNPTNHRGESIFHLACLSQNPRVVEQYLRAGVNVNDPTEFFVDSITSGYTPLHLAVRYRMCTLEGYDEQQIRVVELLLNYGADVRAVDADGNTPLHVVAAADEIDAKIFEMIVEAGADLNAVNVKGQTPLEILLSQLDNRVACNEKIEFLIKRGCRMNAYNPVTGEGYLWRALVCESMDDPTFKAMMSCSSMDDVDVLGRTAIHNVVSITFYKRNINVKVMEYLIGRGCDVDGQDECRETPLHLAAHFGNFQAVEALLLYGADINITDNHGNSALTYILESTKASHRPTTERLARHVFYLELYGLHVKEARTRALDRVRVYIEPEDNRKFIDRMKSIKIHRTPFTLDDFMSETGAVTTYRKMPEDVRKNVEEFFSSACEKFGFCYAKYLFKLQFRKAEKRIGLVECAREAMNVLVKFHLPELCFDAVEKFLSNADLERLVRSVGCKWNDT